MEIFLQYDLPSILLGSLAALACGLLGNFLVLRKQALMGDAISHVVLPGIVLGFLFSHQTGSWATMLGAGAAAVFAVLLIELIRRIGNVEPGAAMGVVFTTMFAAGVVILEQSGASGVHLDVEHALYGNLESAIWLDAYTLSDLWNVQALLQLPESVRQLFVVNALVILFIILFFKELKLTSFDPLLAASLGFSPKRLGLALIVMVAIAAVAAFSAVGSILVIAMFICPAATARMLTDNLKYQLVISGVVSLSAGIFGYLIAAFGPMMLGFDVSVSAAGMIAVIAGLQQLIAMLFAPHYGIVMRKRRHRAQIEA